ncbi:hypothetical protein HK22_02190 [Gluconobacter sp. DsW_056]|uniref:hypothetical protein n=1 Tax=Gluconobacter sp. DsW_056 TaxID=1511209 RepID=UPI000A3A0374|nr:hypothetical protein [Gluconobacter sp. DsW_056]OUI81685.1 hypothetical protein HK22_02190 [Gluconobacter sp. DsW_056]
MDYEKTINFKPVTVNKRTLDSITVELPSTVQWEAAIKGKTGSDGELLPGKSTEFMVDLVVQCSGETALAVKSLWRWVLVDAFRFLTVAPEQSGEEATGTSDETGNE